MIKSFKHQGLEMLYREGRATGVMPQHQHDLQTLLSQLDQIKQPADLCQTQRPIKQLAGDLAHYYAIELRAGWRILFAFDESGVIDLNYIQLPQHSNNAVH